MIRILSLLALLSAGAGSSLAQPFQRNEVAAWQQQSQAVTITRDQWGIAHVKGNTDADAVFGFLYAQCEDDFPRIEMNYINALGRLAEVEGEERLFHDLRTRLFYDSLQAIDYYQSSPEWLQQLCQAFAGGVNYYLHTHPKVKPKLLNRFQPWMPFLFSEGSIGTDVEGISAKALQAFYNNLPTPKPENEEVKDEQEPRGSNGFAIAPARSSSGHALLLINPHTSFYFRPEIHVASNEGLNAYGAVTWGQFFIYQGFNERCGWMHTSSKADAVDEYAETIREENGNMFYRYNNDWLQFASRQISLKFRSDGQMKVKTFTAFYTAHGPVVRAEGDKWITVSLMKEPVKALMQSFLRTKAKNYRDYSETMALRANSSNNTVYADADGNIAYWHGNFIPRRDTTFAWNEVVDGSNPKADWQGIHEPAELIHVLNPANGWLQNCNATPYTVAGAASPSPRLYPSYMAPDKENARGINAVRVLNQRNKFDLDKLIAAAYDPHLAGFEQLVPALVSAVESQAKNDSKALGAARILRTWDYKTSIHSVAATLAIVWGTHIRELILPRVTADMGQLDIIQLMIEGTSPEQKHDTLVAVLDHLQKHFGTWQVKWGDINRYQRLTGKIDEQYDDAQPSLPIPYASSFWGSLAAYGSRAYPNTQRWYGNVGNSFVAVVEFGKKVRAKSLLAGGVSNNPTSPYFFNQAERYSTGNFKDVLFYEPDIARHAIRRYHPGE